jgi:hypothetical protein
MKLTALFGVTTALAAAAQVIDNTLHISIATAMSIGGVVVAGAWWLSRWLTRIETKIDSLPCQKNGCPIREDHKIITK